MSENRDRQSVHSNWKPDYFVVPHLLGIPTLLACRETHRENRSKMQSGVRYGGLLSLLMLQIDLANHFPGYLSAFPKEPGPGSSFSPAPVASDELTLPGGFLPPISSNAPELAAGLHQPGMWFTALWTRWTRSAVKPKVATLENESVVLGFREQDFRAA